MSGRRSAEKVALGRRIKAARELAGITSTKKLSTRINDAGFGKDAIDDWETGNYERDLPRAKVKAIAEACALPYSFFEMDFWAIDKFIRRDEGVPEPAGELRRRLLGGLPNHEAHDEADDRQDRTSPPGGGA